MSKKCEWKDDEKRNELYYMPCGTEMVTILKDRAINLSITEYILKTGWNFCPFCGADIRKPEPEVIVKKSGGTWVALSEHKVNFLCIHPEEYRKDITASELAESVMLGGGNWVHICDELKITDEIAKLRPRVWVEDDSEIDTLYGVRDSESVLWNTGVIFSKYIRLATVSDLP